MELPPGLPRLPAARQRAAPHAASSKPSGDLSLKSSLPPASPFLCQRLGFPFFIVYTVQSYFCACLLVVCFPSRTRALWEEGLSCSYCVCCAYGSVWYMVGAWNSQQNMKSCLWSVFRGWNKRPLSLCGLTMSWCSPRDPRGSGSVGAQPVRTEEELDEPLLKSREMDLARSGGLCSNSSFPQLLSSFLPVLRLSQKCSIQQDENHANYITYANCSSLIPNRHDSH